MEGLRIASYVEDQDLNFPAQSGDFCQGFLEAFLAQYESLGSCSQLYFLCACDQPQLTNDHQHFWQKQWQGQCVVAALLSY